MKKSSFLMAIAIVMLFAFSTTFAQTTPTPSTPQKEKKEIKAEKKAERKAANAAMTPEDHAQKAMTNLEGKVKDLSPEQKTQLKAMFLEHYTAMQNTKVSKKENVKNLQAGLKKILNEKQMASLKVAKKEAKENHQAKKEQMKSNKPENQPVAPKK